MSTIGVIPGPLAGKHCTRELTRVHSEDGASCLSCPSCGAVAALTQLGG